MTRKYIVRVGLLITPEHVGDDVDAFTDQMMEQLAELNDEPDLGGSVASGHFDVSVTVESDAPFDALQQGCLLIKTAAHAAGGTTARLEVPDEWPDWVHEVSLAADPVDSPDLVDA